MILPAARANHAPQHETKWSRSRSFLRAKPLFVMNDLTQKLVLYSVGCLTLAFSDYWRDQLSSATAVLRCVTLSVATVLAWHSSQSPCCADTFNSLRPIAPTLKASLAPLRQIRELWWSRPRQKRVQDRRLHSARRNRCAAMAPSCMLDSSESRSLAGTARCTTSHAASHLFIRVIRRGNFWRQLRGETST